MVILKLQNRDSASTPKRDDSDDDVDDNGIDDILAAALRDDLEGLNNEDLESALKEKLLENKHKSIDAKVINFEKLDQYKTNFKFSQSPKISGKRKTTCLPIHSRPASRTIGTGSIIDAIRTIPFYRTIGPIQRVTLGAYFEFNLFIKIIKLEYPLANCSTIATSRMHSLARVSSRMSSVVKVDFNITIVYFITTFRSYRE